MIIDRKKLDFYQNNKSRSIIDQYHERVRNHRREDPLSRACQRDVDVTMRILTHALTYRAIKQTFMGKKIMPHECSMVRQKSNDGR